ncbi:MAG: YggT family protein [Limnochordaceae bacterium]|nr:YggT family protein [Limnochordaceae bacterium]
MGWLGLLVYRLLALYSWILLARVLVSWLPVDPYHPAVRFLRDVTEPVLAPIRRVLPPVPGIDYSPIVAFLLIMVVQRIVLAVF